MLLILKKELAKTMLIVFLSVALAFNIFFVQEFLFHGTHPDITKITYEMVDYYKQEGFSGPIYTNAASFSIYLNKTKACAIEINNTLIAGKECHNHIEDKDQINFYTYWKYEMDEFYPAIENKAKILITEYYPTIPKDQENKNSYIWEELKNCTLLKKFEDKHVIMGYIFSCHS